MHSLAVSVLPLKSTEASLRTTLFGARAVRLYLREVRDSQSKARGISYEKKKRKRPPQQQNPASLMPPQAPPESTPSASENYQ